MKINDDMDASIHPGAFIAEGVILQDDVQVGASAVILGPSPQDQSTGPTLIRAGAMIGANATIYPGVTVGERAVIRPAAVVTRSVPPLAIVEGHPAVIIGYCETPVGAAAVSPSEKGKERITRSAVAGVTLHSFPFIPDLRGNLTVGEFEREIPFVPQRYFLVFDVPNAETRGEHAHRELEELVICVKGSCHVVVDDGKVRQEFCLDSPCLGLYLPPKVWRILYRFTPDAILLAFASKPYNPADYIRNYNEFLAMVNPC